MAKESDTLSEFSWAPIENVVKLIISETKGKFLFTFYQASVDLTHEILSCMATNKLLFWAQNTNMACTVRHTL